MVTTSRSTFTWITRHRQIMMAFLITSMMAVVSLASLEIARVTIHAEVLHSPPQHQSRDRGETPTHEDMTSVQQIATSPPLHSGGPSREHAAMPPEARERWTRYRKVSPPFTYHVEYPAHWRVEEDEGLTFFSPPDATSRAERISINVLNYKETPPLPVWYTYTTIRTVESGNATIPVQRRQPAPASERYVASIKQGDYTAEFICSLSSAYDEVFDRMLSTFTFDLTSLHGP